KVDVVDRQVSSRRGNPRQQQQTGDKDPEGRIIRARHAREFSIGSRLPAPQTLIECAGAARLFASNSATWTIAPFHGSGFSPGTAKDGAADRKARTVVS